jgi:cell division protein FtsB
VGAFDLFADARDALEVRALLTVERRENYSLRKRQAWLETRVAQLEQERLDLAMQLARVHAHATQT